jgi:aryl-alcohol dehydrogenase-like predicted oxidoreductase
MELMPLESTKKIGTIVWSPLANGKLTENTDAINPILLMRVLRREAARLLTPSWMMKDFLISWM